MSRPLDPTSTPAAEPAEPVTPTEGAEPVNFKDADEETFRAELAKHGIRPHSNRWN